jgi:hypothetical protein
LVSFSTGAKIPGCNNELNGTLMFTNPYSELEKSSPHPPLLSFRICFNIILQNGLLFIERFEELVYKTVAKQVSLVVNTIDEYSECTQFDLDYNTGI